MSILDIHEVHNYVSNLNATLTCLCIYLLTTFIKRVIYNLICSEALYIYIYTALIYININVCKTYNRVARSKQRRQESLCTWRFYVEYTAFHYKLNVVILIKVINNYT